jgi:glycosyltransferase involved in cell wall biosynthesis
MKILFIAMSESIHTSRWISQIKDNKSFDIYLFPSYPNRIIRDELFDIKICIPFFSLYLLINKIIGKKYANFFHIKIINSKYFYSSNKQKHRLKKYLIKIKPDLIHTLETQGAGYLLSEVKTLQNYKYNFPLWWHTNWGSDIYIFGKLLNHQKKIKNVLSNCDFYSCECQRDVDLAIKFGYKNTVLPVFPNTGGLNIIKIKDLLDNSKPTSQRRNIMLKGYQGWAGRALVGIKALSICSDILKDYTIIIYSNTNSEDIKIASQLLSENFNLKVILLEENTPHDIILYNHSLARISIGLSIGDAISTSLLEAMAVGSFPIQSCTSCADEWFDNNITGYVVPPEEPYEIANCIRKAISDDNLVDNASKINIDKISKFVNYDTLKEKTNDIYLTLQKKIYE